MPPRGRRTSSSVDDDSDYASRVDAYGRRKSDRLRQAALNEANAARKTRSASRRYAISSSSSPTKNPHAPRMSVRKKPSSFETQIATLCRSLSVPPTESGRLDDASEPEHSDSPTEQFTVVIDNTISEASSLPPSDPPTPAAASIEQFVKVTVCFLRDNDNEIFKPDADLTGAEHLIHRVAAIKQRNLHKPIIEAGRLKLRNANITEDTFFSTNLSSTSTVTDVKHQIRRLLNVHFNHARPEGLEFLIRIYDENHPEAESRVRERADQLVELASVLVDTREPLHNIIGQLLVVVHGIRRWPTSTFCTREAWAELTYCPTWTFSLQTREAKASGADGDTKFWQEAVERRHERVIQDTISTKILPSHVQGFSHMADPLHLRLSALWGYGLDKGTEGRLDASVELEGSPSRSERDYDGLYSSNEEN